ncbi:ATP-dependent helicase [Clostridium thailandense]|uniref:ATP-dependent helicase n=1 Tax=Clostridium thailandense TaxID=2794346 RepID=UPI003989CB8C
MQFREDQIPIMEYEGGTMAVPAVPGAGKTFIVANLAAKIIEQKRNKLGKVLVVTYMNSAVSNFKNRITSVLNEKGISNSKDYEVMTIHSLAMKILKDRPDIVGVNEEFQILDDLKKVMYLNEGIEEWRRRGGERIFKSFLSDRHVQKYNEKCDQWWRDFFNIADILISELKLNDISPEMLIKQVQNFEDSSIIKNVSYIYDIYTKKLKMQGCIDYNDLLILSYKALTIDTKLREKFQRKYSFIFEDECQDSNLVQCKMLSLLSEDNNNLVRVGDLNQSIMGTFTSSDPKFFAEFCSEADKKYVMNMAGRSSKEIIDVANYLVKYTRNNHAEEKCRTALEEQYIEVMSNIGEYRNPSIEDYGVYSYILSSWDKVKESTIKSIQNFRLKYPDKTIGILVPYNNQVSEISKELREIGIECDELSSTPEKRLKVTNKLGYILSFLGEPDNIFKLREVINNLIDKSGKGKEILLNNLTSYKVEEILEYKIIRDKLYSNKEFIDNDIINFFEKNMDSINHILNYQDLSMEKIILNIGNLLDFNIEDKAMIQAVASYVKYIQKDIPDLSFEYISQILLDVKNSIFKHIADIIYEIKGYDPTPDRVAVATCHKSKGLEWDCVFFLCITNYNFPFSLNGKFRSEQYYFKDEFKNLTTLGKVEIQKILGKTVYSSPFIQAKAEVVSEKVRLLYVGITRAKEYLILMSHKDESKKDYPSKYFEILRGFIEEQREKFKSNIV